MPGGNTFHGPAMSMRGGITTQQYHCVDFLSRYRIPEQDGEEVAAGFAITPITVEISGKQAPVLGYLRPGGLEV
jgi:hypothetical protein